MTTKLPNFDQLPENVKGILGNSMRVDKSAAIQNAQPYNTPQMQSAPYDPQVGTQDQSVIAQITEQIAAVDNAVKTTMGEQQYQAVAQKQNAKPLPQDFLMYGVDGGGENTQQATTTQAQGKVAPAWNATTQQPLNNKPVKTVNPTLLRLREKFGIQQNTVHDYAVSDMHFSFTPLTSEYEILAYDILKVVVSSASFMITNLDILQYGPILDLARAAVSIVAVDNIPVWAMFELQETELKSTIDNDLRANKNPYFPAYSVRERQSLEMFNLIFKEFTSEETDNIIEFYKTTVAPQRTIKEEEKNWRCPKCAKFSFDSVDYDPSGNIIPLFCKYDGTQMEVYTATDEEGESLPPLA